jgi:hypothetical protein
MRGDAIATMIQPIAVGAGERRAAPADGSDRDDERQREAWGSRQSKVKVELAGAWLRPGRDRGSESVDLGALLRDERLEGLDRWLDSGGLLRGTDDPKMGYGHR